MQDEILRLIAGMLDARFVREIIDYLMEQHEERNFSNLLMAAKCLSEVRNRTMIAPTAEKLLKHLINLFDQKLNDKTTSEVLRAITTTWKDYPNTFYWLKTLAESNKYWRVRIAVAQELAKGWKNNPNILTFLKTRAQSDPTSEVQIAVIKELAKGWKDNPDTFPFLKTCAQSAQNWKVREAAMQELLRNWKDDPNILAILITLAQWDKSRNQPSQG